MSTTMYGGLHRGNYANAFGSDSTDSSYLGFVLEDKPMQFHIPGTNVCVDGLTRPVSRKAAQKKSDGANYDCPLNPKTGQYRDGQYEHESQCDAFYECIDGSAKLKYCPDGLVFDSTIRLINKCDQPFNVDCGDRIELQPPQSTQLCPRKNGFFPHPDPGVCNIFYNCIDGDATEVVCTAGLHFDEYTGTCVWPDTAKREGCHAQGKKLKDGFECPDEVQTDSLGQVQAHPKYAHPTDCQRFYVCLNGNEPRDLGCQVGEVYNDETQRCDAPENVQGCEDWYKDSDEPKGQKSPSKGARDDN